MHAYSDGVQVDLKHVVFGLLADWYTSCDSDLQVMVATPLNILPLKGSLVCVSAADARRSAKLQPRTAANAVFSMSP